VLDDRRFHLVATKFQDQPPHGGYNCLVFSWLILCLKHGFMFIGTYMGSCDT
jgi:hypothetical protein